MEPQDDLPMGEADDCRCDLCLSCDARNYHAALAAEAIPEMDDATALAVFRQTAFLHRSVK